MNKTLKDKHLQKQKSFFDWLYSNLLYDYKLAPWHLTYINRIKKHVLPTSKKKRQVNLRKRTLADLGAGQGYITVEMAKLGLNVIACDMSSESIKSINRYKKNYQLKNIKTIKCLVEKLPIKDASIDYIVANAILEHIQNENQTIEEWKRILKPGGRILISVPLYYKYMWPLFWPLNYINDRTVGHLRRYDIVSIKKKFKMKVIHYSYTGHALKVGWALLSLLLKTDYFAQIVEDLDNKKSGQRYGASNIIAVLEKSK